MQRNDPPLSLGEKDRMMGSERHSAGFSIPFNPTLSRMERMPVEQGLPTGHDD